MFVTRIKGPLWEPPSRHLIFFFLKIDRQYGFETQRETVWSHPGVQTVDFLCVWLVFHRQEIQINYAVQLRNFEEEAISLHYDGRHVLVTLTCILQTTTHIACVSIIDVC